MNQNKTRLNHKKKEKKKRKGGGARTARKKPIEFLQPPVLQQINGNTMTDSRSSHSHGVPFQHRLRPILVATQFKVPSNRSWQQFINKTQAT